MRPINQTSSSGKVKTIDLSAYFNANGKWACLITTKGHVAVTSGASSLYLVTGLSTTYNEAIAITSGTFAGVVTVSSRVVTITFYNEDGGGYSVIPLIG